MHISADSVFHFTSSLENIKGILAENFIPQYSIEESLDAIFGKNIGMAIPMVCFCDIPLSQTIHHSEIYGKYAIGLSKNWAVKAGVAPIIYTYPKSILSKELVRLEKNIESVKEIKLRVKLIADFFNTLRFVKPYEGYLLKGGKKSKELVRFYDEKEWRYIPEKDGKFRPFLAEKNYKDEEILATAIEVIKDEKYRLVFEPKNVRYIIVKSENEIIDIHDHIIKIKRKAFTYEEVIKLTTRILTFDRIKADF